jgi:hypothetical protein
MQAANTNFRILTPSRYIRIRAKHEGSSLGHRQLFGLTEARPTLTLFKELRQLLNYLEYP